MDILKFNPFLVPVRSPGRREGIQNAQGQLVAGLGPEPEPYLSLGVQQKFIDEIQPPGTARLGLGIVVSSHPK